MKNKAIPYLVSLIIAAGMISQPQAKAGNFSLSIRTGPSWGYGYGYGYGYPYGYGWGGWGYPYYAPTYINYVPYTAPVYFGTTFVDTTNYVSTLRSPQISTPTVLESGTTKTNRSESLRPSLANDVDLPDTKKISQPGSLTGILQGEARQSSQSWDN